MGNCRECGWIFYCNDCKKKLAREKERKEDKLYERMKAERKEREKRESEEKERQEKRKEKEKDRQHELKIKDIGECNCGLTTCNWCKNRDKRHEREHNLKKLKLNYEHEIELKEIDHKMMSTIADVMGRCKGAGNIQIKRNERPDMLPLDYDSGQCGIATVEELPDSSSEDRDHAFSVTTRTHDQDQQKKLTHFVTSKGWEYTTNVLASCATTASCSSGPNRKRSPPGPEHVPRLKSLR